MAIFADHMKSFGVEQEVMPLEAPWKGGRCERAGGLWKDLWKKVVAESNISGIDDVTLAMCIVTQTSGVPELKLPGSLLAEEPPNLEVMEHAEDPRSQMAKTLNVREAARIAQVRMDTDSRVRRALLRQSTPTRGPFPIGSCTSIRHSSNLELQDSTDGLALVESLALS